MLLLSRRETADPHRGRVLVPGPWSQPCDPAEKGLGTQGFRKYQPRGVHQPHSRPPVTKLYLETIGGVWKENKKGEEIERKGKKEK